MAEAGHAFDELVRGRRSVRAFRDELISEEVVHEILDVSRWSPSGSNMQPWHVTVLTGEALRETCDVAQRTIMGNPDGEEGEFPIYPSGLKEPYRARRFETGEAMYERLGIPRSDKMARLQWLAGNFRFFGAPVGLLFSIDRSLERPQWAHLGMFMQTIALAAEARGLATCMQEAWGKVRDTLADHLKLPETHVLYAGMALGRPDADAPVNGLRTPRLAVEEFATFRGF